MTINNVEFLYKILHNRKKHEMMFNTFSRSLVGLIWEPAIETKAQEMNGGRERTAGPGGLNSSPPWNTLTTEHNVHCVQCSLYSQW